MPELNDHELLAEFARTESEAAFATLVARYVNLVYSTALRFTGNPHHAEEITQAVFIILARKAGKLSSSVVLSGWLYQAARLTAANLVKSEIRRHHREQEAYMQTILNEPDTMAWKQIAPLLDDAMGGLGETDRNAVILSFFENKTAAEVADALKLTEAAAHKRVNRALEKLRKFFTKRGVSSTTAIIAGTISANSVQAAPVALAKSVTAVAIAKGAAASGSTLTLIKGALKIMAWTKAKTAIVTIIVITAVVTPIVLQKKEITRLNQQLANARDETARLSIQQNAKPVQVVDETTQKKMDSMELEVLRLRGQVTQLQNRNTTDAAKPDINAMAQATDKAADKPMPFTIDLTNRVANGQTLVAGGWSQNPGKRTFLLTTPTISQDDSGAKVVRLKSYAVEAPDAFWDQMGWTELKTNSRQSGGLGGLDPNQAAVVLDTIKNTAGAAILSNPTILTSDGGQATFQIGNQNDSQFSLDITPQITLDGQSVDMELHSLNK